MKKPVGWGVCTARALGVALVGCGGDDDGNGTPADPCEGVDGACVALYEGASTDEVLGAFVAAEAGQTIAFGAGTFHLDRELNLNPVPGITIRGAGMDATILSFAEQDTGHGIFVGAGGDDFLIEDLTIQDSSQNGIEVRGTSGITFRRLKVEWTTDPRTITAEDLADGELASPFGRYAIYPTSCNRLLIEDSVARRASDAGIYVGSCNDAILRNNTAEENVSGLQVENTLRADVYGNVAHDNVIGMLVHDLPGQPVNANGDQTRVFDNDFSGNNFVNFSLATDLTTNVPSGTGMAVLARGNVDIYDNLIEDNDTIGLAVISFLMLGQDFSTADGYYPYPDHVHVHGNTFSGNGTSPETVRRGEIVPLGLVLQLMSNALDPDGPVPDVIYDGMLDPEVADANPGEDNPMRICLGDPPDGTFLNMMATPEKLDAAFNDDDTDALVAGISTDDTAFRCELGAEEGFPLPAVSLD
jgi:parallel beta-helix repeat protein